MVARDNGHVINISSIAGSYNFSGNSSYHAKKAAVNMLSNQLRIDAFGKRVRVAEICPGRVATDISRMSMGMILRSANALSTVSNCRKPSILQRQSLSPAPVPVNIGHMEITPTLQVMGGFQTARPATPRSAVLQRTEAVTRFDLSAILANPEFIAMLLHGIEMTFIIAIGSWILAMTLAILLLALHFAPGRFGNAFVAGYVSYQRNVPTLVQLMLWYFSIFTLLPYWLTHWLASHNVEAIFAIIGLGLCRAAYFSEDLRSGLRSVSPPSPRSAFSRRSAALIPRITKGEQR